MSKNNIITSLKEGGCPPVTIMIGSTEHVNHVDCPAGVDTRRRLYVTRNKAPSDLLVWYCHNCGQGGAFKSRLSAVFSHTATETVSSGSGLLNVMDMWEQGIPWVEAPYDVVRWLTYRGAENSAVWDNNVRWHPVKNALLFGVNERGNRDDTGVPWAIQVRNFGSKSGPKWWTCKGRWPAGEPLRTWFGVNQGYLDSSSEERRQERALVLVEDWLSAAAVWHDSLHDSYCLYGAHIGMDELAKIRHELRYDKLLVWLDNDVTAVIKSREDIVKRAKMLGFTEVRVERDYKDPKYCVGLLKTKLWEEYTLA
jgi:hypothetical protein